VVAIIGFTGISYGQWVRTAPYVKLQYNTDNVGIGTLTPTAKLQVRDTTAAPGTKTVFLGTTVGTSCLPAMQLSDGTTTRTVLGLRTGDIAVNNSGNVGIAATSPNTNLQIGSGTFPIGELPGVEIGLGASSMSFFGASDNTKHWIGGVDNTLTYGKTGMLSNHDLAIITNNTSRIYVQAAGNVGIGTSSPDDLLDVNGEIVNGANSGERMSLSATSLGFNRRVRDGHIYYGSAFAYQFYHTQSVTNTSDHLALQVYNAAGSNVTADALVVNGSGNVGINRTDPGIKLDISTGQLRTNTALANALFISTSEAYASNPFVLGIGLAGASTNAARYALFQTGNYGQDAIGNLCFQASGGNVGIGTTSPGEKVDIIQTAGNHSALFVSTSGVSTGQSYGLTVFAGTNSSDRSLGIYDQSGTHTYLYVRGDGNVGIGTTNPGYPLAVNGKIAAKEVIVTQTGWSDYVFKDNYKLKPLSQVADYVKKNKHLEGVPTEAEVKKNGVPIGEMQAKLLEKVEELTLHMIEMKKENDELKAKVSKLEMAAKTK
jgi:hypothetical protein